MGAKAKPPRHNGGDEIVTEEREWGKGEREPEK